MATIELTDQQIRTYILSDEALYLLAREFGGGNDEQMYEKLPDYIAENRDWLVQYIQTATSGQFRLHAQGRRHPTLVAMGSKPVSPRYVLDPMSREDCEKMMDSFRKEFTEFEWTFTLEPVQQGKELDALSQEADCCRG